MAINIVVGYLRQDPEKDIIWWRKETKMTLTVGIIIPKVDIDTKIPGETDPFEDVTYIDASHSTCLSFRRYVGSFLITIFDTTLY